MFLVSFGRRCRLSVVFLHHLVFAAVLWCVYSCTRIYFCSEKFSRDCVIEEAKKKGQQQTCKLWRNLISMISLAPVRPLWVLHAVPSIVLFSLHFYLLYSFVCFSRHGFTHSSRWCNSCILTARSYWTRALTTFPAARLRLIWRRKWNYFPLLTAVMTL